LFGEERLGVMINNEYFFSDSMKIMLWLSDPACVYLSSFLCAYFDDLILFSRILFAGKQQFVESRQQQDLLGSDHKTHLRDFNQKKANDEKRLMNTVKEYKKDNKKKLQKAQLEAYGVQQKSMRVHDFVWLFNLFFWFVFGSDDGRHFL
jgi:hypothetical protein